MLAILICLVPVLFAAAAVLTAALLVIACVFSGIAAVLAAGAFAGKGILPGIVLGFIAYRAFRNSRTAERTD